MKLTHETWFYLLVGTLAGFLLPTDNMEFMLYPLLFIVLCFSLTRLKIHKLTAHEKKTVKWLVLINYLAGAIIILLTLLLVKNPDYQKGLFVLAVMPPAIAVIPFVSLFKGNLREAMMAEVISYFLAILIIPMAIYILTHELVSVMNIGKDLIILLIIPFLISRFLRNHHLTKHSQLFVNLAFMVLFYIVTSRNREVLSNLKDLIPVVILTFIVLFIIPTIYFLSIKRKSERPDFVLFSCMKNGGLSIVLTTSIFSSAAAVPAAVRVIFTTFLIMYFEWLFFKVRR